MSDAFQCDECAEYFSGEPHERLYNKRLVEKHGYEYPLRAELCEECSEDFAGGHRVGEGEDDE